MIIPDVNLLVYAVDQDSPFHQPAKEWWEEALNGTETIGLAWIVVLAFLRLTTRSAIMANPLTMEEALGLIRAWLTEPAVAIIEPGPRHFELLSHLLTGMGVSGNLTSDAHVAAIAIEHDADVYSSDADFGRWKEVRWRNPLAMK